jgi:hypothetical protein
MDPVSLQALEAVAAQAPATPSHSKPAARIGVPQGNGQGGGGHVLDVARWLSDRGVPFRAGGSTADGRAKYLLDACPFNPEHRNGDACIMQGSDGGLSFNCFHDSCSGHGWQQTKQAIGPPDPDHYDPPLRPQRGKGRQPKEPRPCDLLDAATPPDRPPEVHQDDEPDRSPGQDLGPDANAPASPGTGTYAGEGAGPPPEPVDSLPESAPGQPPEIAPLPQGAPPADGSAGPGAGADPGQPGGATPGQAGGPPPPAGQAAAGGQAPRRLNVIVCNDRQLRDVSRDALGALYQRNAPPTTFQRAGLLARLRVDADTGQPSVEILREPALRGRLARTGDWVTVVSNQNGVSVAPVFPPREVVQDVAALPGWNTARIPLLLGITQCPVFDRGGRLIDRPGYDRGARLYYHPDPAVTIPAIPQQPTAGDVQRARDILLGDLLGDFPFADAASKAHTLAAILNPVVRPLVDGPTPLHLLSAPTEGTGKGLLAGAISIGPTGTEPAVAAEFRCEEEARKSITARLIAAPTYLLLDNLRKTLDSAVLAAALTAPRWTDRLLGVSKEVAVPVNCTWLATGNNPKLSRELIRRTVLIRLDAGMEQPTQRTGFKHPHLKRWAREHRGELLWAALTLCQAWVAAGRPRGQQVMGSYESWVEVMGGILDVAGVAGLLDNADELRRTTTDTQSEWKAFVRYWWEEYGQASVGIDRLFALARRQNVLEQVLGDKGERSQRTRLGQALKRKRDQVVGEFKIVAAGEDHSDRQLYRLEQVADQPPGGADEATTPPPAEPVVPEGGERSG